MVQQVLQLTLAIIKPHILKYPPAYHAIHDTILSKQFFIVRSKKEHLTRSRSEKFYEEHKDKFFYNRLVTFMCSGSSEFLVLAKENAIVDWRKLMGPTKVYLAQFSAPDSLRGSFGLSDTRNATHGSDSPETARREIELFFPDFSVDNWYKNEEELFRKGRVKFLPEKFLHVPTDTL